MEQTSEQLKMKWKEHLVKLEQELQTRELETKEYDFRYGNELYASKLFFMQLFYFSCTVILLKFNKLYRFHSRIVNRKRIVESLTRDINPDDLVHDLIARNNILAIWREHIQTSRHNKSVLNDLEILSEDQAYMQAKIVEYLERFIRENSLEKSIYKSLDVLQIDIIAELSVELKLISSNDFEKFKSFLAIDMNSIERCKNPISLVNNNTYMAYLLKKIDHLLNNSGDRRFYRKAARTFSFISSKRDNTIMDNKPWNYANKASENLLPDDRIKIRIDEVFRLWS